MIIPDEQVSAANRVCICACAAVCTELRGDSCYLFGLRVAEEARGNGVGASLMVGGTGHGAVPCMAAGCAGRAGKAEDWHNISEMLLVGPSTELS